MVLTFDEAVEYIESVTGHSIRIKERVPGSEWLYRHLPFDALDSDLKPCELALVDGLFATPLLPIEYHVFYDCDVRQAAPRLAAIFPGETCFNLFRYGIAQHPISGVCFPFSYDNYCVTTEPRRIYCPVSHCDNNHGREDDYYVSW
ncbi:MAG: hypothetical protein D6712_11100 [Chloroflexi bacterium]|nr:MAG: hypothetical protein D6712_11100 [Chloroflexota bacterium]